MARAIVVPETAEMLSSSADPALDCGREAALADDSLPPERTCRSAEGPEGEGGDLWICILDPERFSGILIGAGACFLGVE